MAGDVLSSEAVYAHELHYGLGNGVLDPEMGHGVDESFVELRRPNQPRSLQGACWLVAGVAGGHGVRGSGEVWRVEIRRRRRRWCGARVMGRDIEGKGEVGGDERLGEGHKLFGAR